MSWLVGFLLGILGRPSPQAGRGNACAAPSRLGFKVLRAIPRGSTAFTEGLFFFNGYLYESSGLYGSSAIHRLDPGTGAVTPLAYFSASIFAEGLDEWNGSFAMLTWHEGRILRWRSGFAQPPDPDVIPYPRAGWGLTHDSEGWIASDGSDVLYFLDRASFREIRTIHVRNERMAVAGLNELEFADGTIFANLFPTSVVARIDPMSGCVLGLLDLSSLRSRLSPGEAKRISANPDAVLNGIAYDPGEDVFYLAGKTWPIVFKLRISAGPGRGARR